MSVDISQNISVRISFTNQRSLVGCKKDFEVLSFLKNSITRSFDYKTKNSLSYTMESFSFLGIIFINIIETVIIFLTNIDSNLTKSLYESITPVNTFRIMFNQFHGGDFEILKDQTYFSKYETPFNFIPITKE